MSESFLSSDEYDERASKLCEEGQYDEALELLKEGIDLYPHSADLHVGLGYARLAREEYPWARRAFCEALDLDQHHEEALAGLGEVLLKFGNLEGAFACFARVEELGYADDHDLMLQIGRVLFREGCLHRARRQFELVAHLHPESAEASACVGYAAHRLNEEETAVWWLRRALDFEPNYVEARIYLANLLYDRGHYDEALEHYTLTDVDDHTDELALWRLIELKKTLFRLESDDPEILPLFDRLAVIATEADPDTLLLEEIEARAADGTYRDRLQLDLFAATLTALPEMQRRSGPGALHSVRLRNGQVFSGTFEEIVLQMKDESEYRALSAEEFMRVWALECRQLTGREIPTRDAEAFIRASARADLLHLLH